MKAVKKRKHKDRLKMRQSDSEDKAYQGERVQGRGDVAYPNKTQINPTEAKERQEPRWKWNSKVWGGKLRHRIYELVKTVWKKECMPRS